MRAALVGTGHIARHHLACMKTLPTVEVVAVCDRSPATAEATAERYAVPNWFCDHRSMLDQVKPDVLHVTTPPTSHFGIAMDALDSGTNVIVEKPATSTFDELERLLKRSQDTGLHVVEDYTFLFDRQPAEILKRVESGEFGAVTHVEVMVCLNILGPSGFADPNAPHPALKLAGGAIADFLPHLASLSHQFVGPHKSAQTIWTKRKESALPYDEFRAIVEAERGTAALSFSASSQPDGFWLRVYGEKMQAAANLWETRLTFDGPRNVPRPLRTFFSALDEGKSIRRAAYSTLLRKFGSKGGYDGLWTFLERTYEAMASGAEMPVKRTDIYEINRLVEALKPNEQPL